MCVAAEDTDDGARVEGLEVRDELLGELREVDLAALEELREVGRVAGHLALAHEGRDEVRAVLRDAVVDARVGVLRGAHERDHARVQHAQPVRLNMCVSL